mgnify:CR=1 FL=1
MINDETKRKLDLMSMHSLVEAFEVQEKEILYNSMTFDERINSAVDHAYQIKYNEKVKGLIRRAHFRYPHASAEDIYYSKRELDKDQILSLINNSYIDSYKNILIVGFTGSGKTFLSNCLGKAACRDGISTRYIRIPDLFVLLEESELKRGRNKLIKKFSNCPLLILDEWLINTMSEEEIEFIFELVERRYQWKSTIFCTQYKIESWHTRLGGGVHADAIMDRIIHNSITINAGDINMREVESKMNKE